MKFIYYYHLCYSSQLFFFFTLLEIIRQNNATCHVPRVRKDKVLALPLTGTSTDTADSFQRRTSQINNYTFKKKKKNLQKRSHVRTSTLMQTLKKGLLSKLLLLEINQHLLSDQNREFMSCGIIQHNKMYITQYSTMHYKYCSAPYLSGTT